jgi:spore maturation protein CgeB
LIVDVEKLESVREITPQSEPAPSFRILCIGETWFGSDARAAFAALRRLGQSVEVIDENNYVPQGRSTLVRGIRKILRGVLVRELASETIVRIERFKPDCFFVFKGYWLHPDVLQYCREHKVITVNYYPDVSFLSHGKLIPKSLPLYDHIFTAKSYGVRDLRSTLNVTNATFLEPGFDPELHRPIRLTSGEQDTYGCDVGFIGTWSVKKEKLLASLRRALPEISIKIWGFQWEKHIDPDLQSSIVGHGITGDDYTKAVCGARICLGLLSEQGEGSSSGDLITARTFQIPACGTFMLHERNAEVIQYFEEGQEAEFFSSAEELAQKVSHYLAANQERQAIAQNGLRRSQRDDYSIDNRMKVVLGWLANAGVKSEGASAWVGGLR